MATLAGRRNRNDLFSVDFSILPPGKASPSASASSAPLPLQSPRSQATYEADVGIASSSTIELCRSEHRLGHGRHADVYLGSYRENGGKWRACAVKRLGRDKEARSAGLNEAALLQRLSPCPQVVTYLGLKEESEEAAPRTTTSKLSASAKGRSPLAPRYSPGSHSAPSSPSHEASGFHFEDLAGSLRRSSTVKASQPRSRLSLQAHDGAESLPPPSRLLLLTQFYPLGNLADFVSKYGRDHLGRTLFFKLASDLLKAVVACHAADIIHADVKPQNCMLDSSLNLVLGDFSSSVNASCNLVDGVGIGSTQYCAPELVKLPPQAFSFPVDVFAAGLTLLYMLSGVEPYESLTTQSRPVSRRASLEERHSLNARRSRASSGAGKMVEMHLHLSKGHAWEWEEKRRLDELEDAEELQDRYTITSDPHQSPRKLSLPHRVVDDVQLEESIEIPLWAIDLPDDQPVRSKQTYSDGFTPVQYFMTARRVVPESLRTLIQQMLSPIAADRPSAREALRRLQNIEEQIVRRANRDGSLHCM